MLMNTRRLGWLEQDLLCLFEAVREEIPACHALSFSMIKHASGEVEMTVYYHEGDKCFMLGSIEELFAIYKKHQILFQKFDGNKI